MQKNSRGFTLIELLVVISIIALLSSVVISALGSARAKARDAKRYESIREINTAIQLYILNNNGAPSIIGAACADPYPEEGNNTNDCQTFDYDSHWSLLAAQLQPYIKTLSKDPCGLTCAKVDENNPNGSFLVYTYQAPGHFNLDSEPKATRESYAIYAQNMETKAVGYYLGFGSL